MGPDPYVIWVQIQIEMFEVYQVGIPHMYFKMCQIHIYALEKLIAFGSTLNITHLQSLILLTILRPWCGLILIEIWVLGKHAMLY